MLLGLDFVSAAADHIETTTVFEIADMGLIYLDVVACIDTFGSIAKTKELGVFVDAFDVVVDADYYVVSTCGLAA